MQYLNEIIAAMTRDGLLVHNLNFDGQLYRLPIISKPNKQDASYIAFPDGTGVWYLNWVTGVEKVFSIETKVITRDDLLKRKAAKAAYKQVKLDKQRTSAMQCQSQWAGASEVIAHPYLTRKKITPYGSRVDEYNNLLVPVLDDSGGLVNLQSIKADGYKLFKAGARVKGCAFLIGSLTSQTMILVCEGYATGCSLHEATGLPVIVAFNAGNLLDVCTSLKRREPKSKIILCADNDHQTEVKSGHNTGIDKAKVIHEKLNLQIVWPTFDSENLGSDFNDVHCQLGLEGLRTMLSPVLLGAFL